ncbi:MAG: amidohydrolase family protein [Rhodospirillaceae bacterium]|jgi:predicted TIM-barrel fold metal-dependent hydrolase|nr:amidohydrolase family protein [Rhodospirillaceae bacterium]MBT5943181.1 amidohydrolase family protein [Rhodospirillaceae bacterium]MBT7362078.1 amidohydrolase family protein [Rhodospirillaceae bacterium]
MYDGPIIDTHHHIWVVRNYPWLTAPPSPKIFGPEYELLRRDYLIDDLLADFGDNNVVKSVHEQAHYNPPDHVGETRWLQGVADEHGFPHGIVGHADIAGDDIGDVLDGHLEFANFRGIRHVVAWHPDKSVWQVVDRPDFCMSPEFRRGLEELEARDVHFELQGFANQFDIFTQLVAGHPGLRFCLVHGGLLTGDDDETFDDWRRAIEPLAKFDNLSVKCSGPNVINWETPRPLAAVSRQYNALIDMFGAGRCFFGSNFPVEKLMLSYDEVVALCRAALADRTAAEQRAFFHDTAAAFYRLT